MLSVRTRLCACVGASTAKAGTEWRTEEEGHLNESCNPARKEGNRNSSAAEFLNTFLLAFVFVCIKGFASS